MSVVSFRQDSVVAREWQCSCLIRKVATRDASLWHPQALGVKAKRQVGPLLHAAAASGNEHSGQAHTSPYCSAVPLPNSPPAAASYLFKSASAHGTGPSTSAADNASAAPAFCRRCATGVSRCCCCCAAEHFALERCAHFGAVKSAGRALHGAVCNAGGRCMLAVRVLVVFAVLLLSVSNGREQTN